MDAFETDRWAVSALLKNQYLNTGQTLRFLDPCYGLGMITKTIASHLKKAETIYGDLVNWNNAPELNLGDFLLPESASWIDHWTQKNLKWDCIMNPPFKHSAQFIERAIELGANKICVFEKASFLGSVSRQGFWNNAPLTHILYCAQRANCKRFDLVEKSLNSTTHDHAWFIFESNAKHKSKHPTVERIYK